MTRTTRHHLTSTAILLTSVLLVAGCTDDDAEPEASSSELPLPASVTASPSDEPSPTPSPSPSGPEKPERPAAMDKKDGDGAAAAAEYFFQLEHYMFVSGDKSDYANMAHQACGYCDSNLENFKWLEKNQATYEGGDQSVEVLTTYLRDPVTAIWPIDVRVNTKSFTIRDASGEEVENVDSHSTDLRVEIGLRDGAWVVTGVPAMPEDT